jgi:hypothetical protein
MVVTIGRKPSGSSVCDCIIENQCGGINIKKTRLSSKAKTFVDKGREARGTSYNWANTDRKETVYDGSLGRFPANVLISESVCPEMDKQSGVTKSPKTYVRNADGYNNGVYSEKKMIGETAGTVSLNFGDEGGASKFFKVIQE